MKFDIRNKLLLVNSDLQTNRLLDWFIDRLLNSASNWLGILSELDVVASYFDDEAMVSAGSYRPDFRRDAQPWCNISVYSVSLVTSYSIKLLIYIALYCNWT